MLLISSSVFLSCLILAATWKKAARGFLLERNMKLHNITLAFIMHNHSR